MEATILFSLLALSFQLLSANATFMVKSSCSGLSPVVNNSGPGCSIPSFVDPKQFGDNLQSSGRLYVDELEYGTRITVKVDGLSRPDLVLTAWVLWADPSSDLPEIFNIAHYCAPAAASVAGFSSGMGTEPNGLQYESESSAMLSTRLDFHLTKPHFGPLVGKRPSFQSDIPGIEKTSFKQFNATIDGRVIPVAANFLRVFDAETGFPKFYSRGRPNLVRSPTSAFGIAVVAHTDRTTHGISPGFGGVDHFEVLFFDLTSSKKDNMF